MKTILSFVMLLSLSMTSAFADVVYSDSADLNKSHTNVRISDVEFRNLPSKTETRRIPNCIPYRGREMNNCYEVVVLETKPAVQVTISYKDGIFRDHDRRMNKRHFVLNFRPETFSEAEVEELKSISKWDLWGRYHNLRMEWAARKLELQQTLEVRDIQIVDMRTSRFCTYRGQRYPDRIPGCVEVINYKPGKQTVNAVKVLVKE